MPTDDSVATRLRRLRGRRPQPLIAAGVGVSLRAYQQWEAGGGIAWHNLDALAKFHSVSTDWLLGGQGQSEHTADELESVQASLEKILEAMAAETERLDSIETTLQALLGIALERELESAVEHQASPALDASSADDGSG